MFNVLVIDDDAELVKLLYDFFAESEFVLQHAGDSESGWSLLVNDIEKWDILVLDITLPGISGMEILKRLRESPQTSSLPVLMLTALGAENDRVAGLEAGADDYLPKPFSLVELAARLRAILRRAPKEGRNATSPKKVISLDDLVIDPAALMVLVRGKNVRLTPMEMRVLEFLVAEPGRTVARTSFYKEMSAQLLNQCEKWLNMAISRLRRKLGPRSDGTDRIQAVWGEGYVFLTNGENE